MAELGMARRPLGLPVLAAVPRGDWHVPAIAAREQSAGQVVVALVVVLGSVPHA